jgi:hypothetical protein
MQIVSAAHKRFNERLVANAIVYFFSSSKKKKRRSLIRANWLGKGNGIS